MIGINQSAAAYTNGIFAGGATLKGIETKRINAIFGNNFGYHQAHNRSSAKIPQNAIVCDGTRILKNWGGTTHEVLITERGVNWNAQSYKSLSAVARAMTGTNRNEPKFFELREGTK